MRMKKKWVIIAICTFIIAITYSGIKIHKYNTAPENTKNYVFSNISSTGKTIDNNKVYSERFTVISNQEVTDIEKYAEDFFENTRKNNLNGIFLSTDMNGYPTEMNVTVYRTKKDLENSTPYFSFSYTQEELHVYNIKDNPEKFTLTIQK